MKCAVMQVCNLCKWLGDAGIVQKIAVIGQQNGGSDMQIGCD